MTQEEVLDLVYLVLGNPSIELLPNEIVNHYIDQWEVIYPLNTNDCLLTYKVVISCVNYMISKLTSEGNVAGKELSEKEGDVEIEVKYKDKGEIDGWTDWLSLFLKNPVDFLPCLADTAEFGSSTAVPIVTGLKRDKYEDVLADTNNISNGYRIGSIWETSENRRLDSFIRREGTFRGRRRR